MKKYIVELPDDSYSYNNSNDEELIDVVTISTNSPSSSIMIRPCKITPYEESEEFKLWRADISDQYWYVNGLGEVTLTTEGGCTVDNWNYQSGNYFKTKEEAEFYKEEILVHNELKAYAQPDEKQIWDNDTKHYFLELEGDSKNIDIDFFYLYKRSDLHFTSEENVKQAIEKVGEDRIKKYYLHVKD